MYPGGHHFPLLVIGANGTGIGDEMIPEWLSSVLNEYKAQAGWVIVWLKKLLM
jgi:hypothetical protein